MFGRSRILRSLGGRRRTVDFGGLAGVIVRDWKPNERRDRGVAITGGRRYGQTTGTVPHFWVLILDILLCNIIVCVFCVRPVKTRHGTPTTTTTTTGGNWIDYYVAARVTRTDRGRNNNRVRAPLSKSKNTVPGRLLRHGDTITISCAVLRPKTGTCTHVHVGFGDGVTRFSNVIYSNSPRVSVFFFLQNRYLTRPNVVIKMRCATFRKLYTKNRI